MKTNALLAFFFFLVSLFASTRADFVRDTEGHLVAKGGIYYLKILMARAHSPWWRRIETPLRAAYITTDYPIQISFDPLPSNPCTKRPKWLVTWDEDFEQNAVMVGDRSEFPHPLSGRLYFKTYEPDRHRYSLVFCFDQYRCGAVAIKTDHDNNRRLIVTKEQELGEPLVIKLVKTPPDNVASHVSMVV